MIRFILLVLVLFYPLADLQSQNVRSFLEFANSKEKEFNAFYDKIEKDISQLLKEKWEMYESMQSKAATRKFPESPVVFDDKSSSPKLIGSELKIKDINFELSEKKDSTLINNIDSPPAKELTEERTIGAYNEGLYSVLFFGAEFYFNANQISEFKLESTSEEDVSRFYDSITKNDNNSIISVLLKAREKYSLPDWSVYLLSKKISEQLFKDSGARAIFEMYLLNKAGFDSRICRNNNRLLLMIPTNEIIYGYSYLSLEDKDYYIMGDVAGPIYTYGKNGSNNKKSLNIRYNQIALPRKLLNKPLKISEDKINVTVNKNLIDMLNEFPDMHFSSYCKVPFSKELEESLIKGLKSKTSGMNQVDVLNYLLNFVQKSFEYKTDNQQFGKERVLFAEEIFHYPYSDCEDRSILFSMLVKEILHLEVALVNYPNHLATAVNLKNEEINGDFFTIKGKKFFVCDPTYINAPAGESMPDIKDESAKLYLLD